MPPRTTSTSTSTDAAAKKSRGKKTETPAPAATPSIRLNAPEPPEMQTFREHTGARPYVARSENDDVLRARTFQLPIGVVERVRATSNGVLHRAYDTDIEDQVPENVSGFIMEAVEAACTYYEDLLNEGQEFKRVQRLSPGPGRSGAARGGQKRAEKAAAKRESGNQA